MYPSSSGECGHSYVASYQSSRHSGVAKDTRTRDSGVAVSCEVGGHKVELVRDFRAGIQTERQVGNALGRRRVGDPAIVRDGTSG